MQTTLFHEEETAVQTDLEDFISRATTKAVEVIRLYTAGSTVGAVYELDGERKASLIGKGVNCLKKARALLMSSLNIAVEDDRSIDEQCLSDDKPMMPKMVWTKHIRGSRIVYLCETELGVYRIRRCDERPKVFIAYFNPSTRGSNRQIGYVSTLRSCKGQCYRDHKARFRASL